MLIISKSEVSRIAGNKFISISFLKKDGTQRTINGRLHVQRNLKGGDNPNTRNDAFLIIYSIKDKGYRTINLDSVFRVAASGKEYLIAGVIWFLINTVWNIAVLRKKTLSRNTQ